MDELGLETVREHVLTVCDRCVHAQTSEVMSPSGITSQVKDSHVHAYAPRSRLAVFVAFLARRLFSLPRNYAIIMNILGLHRFTICPATAFFKAGQ